MTPYEHLPAAMTVRDIMQELQLGQRAVLDLINTGTLPAMWLSQRCVRVKRTDFVEFISKPHPKQAVLPASPERLRLHGSLQG